MKFAQICVHNADNILCISAGSGIRDLKHALSSYAWVFVVHISIHGHCSAGDRHAYIMQVPSTALGRQCMDGSQCMDTGNMHVP